MLTIVNTVSRARALSLSQALATPRLNSMLTFGNAMMPPGNVRESLRQASKRLLSGLCAR